MLHRTLNWKEVEDELDDYVWDKATAQFGLILVFQYQMICLIGSNYQIRKKRLSRKR